VVPVVRFLADISAWVRYPEPGVATRMDELCAAGAVASCGVVDLHLLSALPDMATYATVASLRRAAVMLLDTTDGDLRRALDVQALLVEAGHHGVPWPAILVAAIAERHGVVVLHATPCFAPIVTVTGVDVEDVRV
jgi:predicted nucleic acid-binding protein